MRPADVRRAPLTAPPPLRGPPPHFMGRRRAAGSAACGQAVGEGAGQPGLARCLDSVTVSTRQAVPRDRFPHALRLAALMRAFDGSSRTPCDGRDGTDVTLQLRRHRPAPQGARRASRQDPSLSARTPGLSIARASSLDHSPPSSRNVDPTPSPSDGMGRSLARGLPVAGRKARETAMCLERPGNIS